MPHLLCLTVSVWNKLSGPRIGDGFASFNQLRIAHLSVCGIEAVALVGFCLQIFLCNKSKMNIGSPNWVHVVKEQWCGIDMGPQVKDDDHDKKAREPWRQHQQ